MISVARKSTIDEEPPFGRRSRRLGRAHAAGGPSTPAYATKEIFGMPAGPGATGDSSLQQPLQLSSTSPHTKAAFMSEDMVEVEKRVIRACREMSRADAVVVVSDGLP